jgi:hypothetical protein
MRAAIVFALTGLASFAAQADVPSIGGVWLVEKPQAEVKTVAGKVPPLQPEAAKVYAERRKAKAAGKTADDPLEMCVPHGVPRLLNAARPIQILQKPKQVTVLYEANHQARLFYIDEPVPSADAAPDITYNGSSYARWDGNALVVDTIAHNDQTWLDDSGLPHGLALKTVERYELVKPDRLRVTVTITDPENYTAPWDMQVVYRKRPDLRLSEDACSEKFWHPGKDAGS